MTNCQNTSDKIKKKIIQGLKMLVLPAAQLFCGKIKKFRKTGGSRYMIDRVW